MKKIIIYFLIISLLLQVGCTSSAYLTADEYSYEYKDDLTAVTLKDSTLYNLEEHFHIIKNDTLFVYNVIKNNKLTRLTIPFDDISSFTYNRVDPQKTTLLGIGITAGVIAGILFIAYLTVDIGVSISGTL